MLLYLRALFIVIIKLSVIIIVNQRSYLFPQVVGALVFRMVCVII